MIKRARNVPGGNEQTGNPFPIHSTFTSRRCFCREYDAITGKTQVKSTVKPRYYRY